MEIHERRRRWLTLDALGFAAHWAWIWCVFWSNRFYDEGAALESLVLSPVSMLEPLWVLSLFSNVVAIAALLLVARVRNPLSELRSLPVEGAVLTALGTLCASLVPDLVRPEAASTVYLMGAVLTGVGSATVVVLWGERLAECGPRYLVRCFVAAIFLGAAAYGLLAALPPMASQVAVAALPVVSMGIYLDQTRRRPRLPQQYRNVRVRARIPVPLVLVALFFGFSFGLMKGLMAPVGPSWIAVRDALNIVAIVAAAGAFYVTSVVYRMDFDHLTYQVALPLVAAGFLFLPLREPLSVVGTAVYQFGYQYFYLVLWAIWAVLAAREKLPAAWVCAWGLLAIQIGQLAGSLAADLGLGFLVGDGALAMLSAAVIFATLIVSLFVFSGRSASTGWGSVRPMEEEARAAEGRTLEDACDALSRRSRLTVRETDVFCLLARGRNRAFICKELVIGDETVKSHVKAIYRKLNVHSQQELINLVEEERAEG